MKMFSEKKMKLFNTNQINYIYLVCGTFKDLYSVVPGNLMGKQIKPLMNSSNSLFNKSKSSPGPTLIKTLIKIGNVIWYICMSTKSSKEKR